MYGFGLSAQLPTYAIIVSVMETMAVFVEVLTSNCENKPTPENIMLLYGKVAVGVDEMFLDVTWTSYYVDFLAADDAPPPVLVSQGVVESLDVDFILKQCKLKALK